MESSQVERLEGEVTKELEKKEEEGKLLDLSLEKRIEISQTILDKNPEFSKVEDVYNKWFSIEDLDYVKMIHAVFLTHRFDADPVWMLIIAPPSGNKTSALMPFLNVENTFHLGNLTQNTFLSADQKEESFLYSLQRYYPDSHLQTHGVLISKDFTTILGKHPDTRAEIMSQFREIYDGHYTKRTGYKKQVNMWWKGKVTFLAGCTNIYETYRNFEQALGERFLYIKPKHTEKGRQESAYRAVYQIGRKRQMESELGGVVKEYHHKVVVPLLDTLLLPDELLKKIVIIADLVTRARSTGKEDYRGELEYIPKIEMPGRLSQQLVTIAKALCVVNKKTVMTEEEYRVVARIGVMTIPDDKLAIIDSLINLKEGVEWLSTTELTQEVHYPKNTLLRKLHQLKAFEIIDCWVQGQDMSWKITDKFKDLVKGCL